MVHCPVHALNDLARRVFREEQRAPSPTGPDAGDDSVDLDLDPELAVIARTAKIEVQREVSSTPAFGAGSSRSPSPVRGGQAEVTIRVRWISHPLNPDPKRITYEYKMRRVRYLSYCSTPIFSHFTQNDSFREMFDETADSAGVLVDHLIITYEGKRIFPSSSPYGVGVWDEASFGKCNLFIPYILNAKGP